MPLPEGRQEGIARGSGGSEDGQADQAQDDEKGEAGENALFEGGDGKGHA